MTAALSQRKSALLAIAILIFAMVAALWLVAHAVTALDASRRAEVESSLQNLARFRAVIASRPPLEAELNRIVKEGAAIPGLLPGANASLAAANMQGMVKPIVAESAGEIGSSQNLPPANVGGFEKIEISYDIALPANRLKDLVYRLETHTPFLFLDNIDIQMPPFTPQSVGSAIPKLHIHWIVRAYRWAEKP